MEIVLRVFQVFLAIGLIGVVLLQRSEGGGLGMGSGGGMGSFMSVRGTANFLTRATAVLAFLFMLTCLVLAIVSRPTGAQKSIFDSQQQQRAPVTAPPVSAPPAAPAPSETLPGAAPQAGEKPLSSQMPAPAATDQKAPQPGPAPAPKQ